MKRTTIVLPDDLAALLDWERRRRGISTAAVVREALDAYLGKPRGHLAITALGRSGHRHTARDVEAILAREWTYERLMGRSDAAAPSEPFDAAADDPAYDPAEMPGVDPETRSPAGIRSAEGAADPPSRVAISDDGGDAAEVTPPPYRERARS